MKAQVMNFISASSADEESLYQYIGNVLANSEFSKNKKMDKRLSDLGAMIRNGSQLRICEVKEFVDQFISSEDNDVDPYENEAIYRQGFGVRNWLEYSKLQVGKKQISADVDIAKVSINLFNTKFSDIYNPMYVIDELNNLANLGILITYLVIFPQQQTGILVLAQEGRLISSMSVVENDKNRKDKYDNLIQEAIELGVCTKEEIVKLNEGIDPDIEFRDTINDGKTDEVRYAEVTNKFKENVEEYVEENILMSKEEAEALSPEEYNACLKALNLITEGVGLNN